MEAEMFVICRIQDGKLIPTRYAYTDLKTAKGQCTRTNHYGYYKGDYIIVSFKANEVIV